MRRRFMDEVRAAPLWAKVIFGLVLVVVLVTLLVNLIDNGSESGSGDGSETGGSSLSPLAEQVKAQAEADAASVDDPNFIGERKIDVTCAGSLCKASLSSDAVPLPLASDVYAAGQIQPVKGQSRIITYLQNDAQQDCTGAVADSHDLRAAIPCLENRP